MMTEKARAKLIDYVYTDAEGIVVTVYKPVKARKGEITFKPRKFADGGGNTNIMIPNGYVNRVVK